jgi:hypothetical protein
MDVVTLKPVTHFAALQRISLNGHLRSISSPLTKVPGILVPSDAKEECCEGKTWGCIVDVSTVVKVTWFSKKSRLVRYGC